MSTAPAIWPGTDPGTLENAIFGGPRCTFCGEEADHTGLYEPLRACPHTEWPYCLPHTIAVIRQAAADGPDFKCSRCGTRVNELRYIKVVPVR